MALLPVVQKPLTGQARQFDGTLDSLLDLLNGRSKANLAVSLQFDQAGTFVRVSLTGDELGGSLSVGVGDWAIFPTNPAQPAFALTNTEATASWQAS